jgi:hypothetical protein
MIRDRVDTVVVRGTREREQYGKTRRQKYDANASSADDKRSVNET